MWSPLRGSVAWSVLCCGIGLTMWSPLRGSVAWALCCGIGLEGGLEGYGLGEEGV